MTVLLFVEATQHARQVDEVVTVVDEGAQQATLVKAGKEQAVQLVVVVDESQLRGKSVGRIKSLGGGGATGVRIVSNALTLRGHS